MKEKISLLTTNAIDTPQLCLEQIKKLIDAQLDFNKCLAEHVIKGCDQEVSEILISMHLNLSKAPKIQMIPECDTFNLFKKTMIKHIIADIAEFQKLKDFVNDKHDLDHLYLKTYCYLNKSLSGLKDITKQKYKFILSFFYTGNDLKKALKQTIKNSYKKNFDSAISADINSLNEMLTLLSPHVSAHCLKFKNTLQITTLNNVVFAGFINDSENKIFEKKITSLRDNYSIHPELYSLLKQYYSIESKLILNYILYSSSIILLSQN